MKYEILKKTLLYRSLAFVLGMFITILIFWKDPLTALSLALATEGASVVLYYIYEYSWRNYVERRRLKEGTSVLSINGDSRVRIAYEVIEDLGEGKLIIKVV